MIGHSLLKAAKARDHGFHSCSFQGQRNGHRCVCAGRVSTLEAAWDPASTNASMSISLPLERAGMKAIITRLRRLEERVANHETGGPSWVDVLRERRRRRLEASGLPYGEPAREPLGFGDGGRTNRPECLLAARARRTTAPL